jgi:hypothetical protein
MSLCWIPLLHLFYLLLHGIAPSYLHCLIVCRVPLEQFRIHRHQLWSLLDLGTYSAFAWYFFYIYRFTVFVLITTLSIVFSHGKDGSISATTKALQFKDPSPEQALDNTEDLAPSVQHKEVDMSISTLCTSIFCKSISSYALFVFYIRLPCLHLILQILQLSSTLNKVSFWLS